MNVPLAVAALVAAVLCYGASSLLLSAGSRSVAGRAYLSGMAFQALAFLLAFAARAELPLLLVQSASTASVAITALLGAATRRWRLTASDGGALAAVVVGITAVGAASRPGGVHDVGYTPLIVATVLGLASMGGLVPAARLGATGLGALAGIAYGSSAVGARALAADPLAAFHSGSAFLAAVLVVGGTLAGQVLLTVAFRRAGGSSSSSVTGPVSAMYVVETVWPSLAGLWWLGDHLHSGRELWAVVGVAAALAGTALLARHETPS